MRKLRGLKASVLMLVLVLGLTFPASAVSDAKLQKAVTESAEYIYKTVSSPQIGSIGGEWAIMGLSRSGYEVPKEYYRSYYAGVEAYVTSCKGVLDQKKYTEYSRVILALTAIGKDPADVGGYNLLTPLGDFDKTVWQGVNGSIWALIALDSGNYAIPQNTKAATQATRQMYVGEILEHQLADGGWSLNGEGGSTEPADPDITGMALQALAKYQSQEKVRSATGKALNCLSSLQDKNGGFSSWGTLNSKSVVQVVVALCELGVSISDSRFVKDGNTLLDDLFIYRKTDGSFQYDADGSAGSDQMASEQGFYGIVAALRAENGKSSLYRMSDAINIGEDMELVGGEGLPGKSADVKAMPIVDPGASFEDVVYSDNAAAIEALAARGIINGKDNGLFDPNADMTRAEFAAIITRGLGLVPEDTGRFTDVQSTAWYAGYIGSANKYGIVNGLGNGMFNPNGAITRQEAAAMVARAAGLCGMDTEMSASVVRDMLAQFGDYVTVASWAQASMAFCYRESILDQSALNIEPTREILRGEIAQMLFNMLTKANLI